MGDGRRALPAGIHHLLQIRLVSADAGVLGLLDRLIEEADLQVGVDVGGIQLARQAGAGVGLHLRSAHLADRLIVALEALGNRDGTAVPVLGADADRRGAQDAALREIAVDAAVGDADVRQEQIPRALLRIVRIEEAGVEAGLVGEALMRAPDKKAKLSELRGE